MWTDRRRATGGAGRHRADAHLAVQSRLRLRGDVRVGEDHLRRWRWVHGMGHARPQVAHPDGDRRKDRSQQSACRTGRRAGSLSSPRRHLNATVLPDGQVLVTGGVSGGGFNDVNSGVRAAEIWNPSTNEWTTLASNAVTRAYHSVSILMVDGTVLHGASGDANVPGTGTPYPAQRNHEIFRPPYLFKGARPEIADAPASVGYGQSFTVTTPAAAQITHVRAIRLGSVTHAFDANTMAVSLEFTRGRWEPVRDGATQSQRGSPGSLHDLCAEPERRPVGRQDRPYPVARSCSRGPEPVRGGPAAIAVGPPLHSGRGSTVRTSAHRRRSRSGTARAIWSRGLSSGAARGGARRPRGAEPGGGDAHRRRQVALLSASRAPARRPHRCGLSTHRPHEGPGGRASGAGTPRGRAAFGHVGRRAAERPRRSWRPGRCS